MNDQDDESQYEQASGCRTKDRQQTSAEQMPPHNADKLMHGPNDTGFRSGFQGQGIQNSGTGNITVGRDVIIGQPKADADANARFLADLRTTDPRDDKTRIERTKGGLLRDSYTWVLKNDDFQRWRDNEHDRLLWIKGDPGKGKTMLLCGIIDELQKSIPNANLLSYAFCQATDVRLNSAMAILRGILYLLLVQNPKMIESVRQQYDHAGQSLFNDVNTWDVLSKMLISILQRLGPQMTYLIIDALDECEADLDQLLGFVVNITSSCRVKLVVSSRNGPNVVQRLSTAPQHVPLCLELNQDSISAAVRTYIAFKVEELNRLKKYDVETRAAVQQHLETNSNDTFLWVALVCQELADPRTRKRHTRHKLKSFPPKLYPLYKRMMDQVQESADHPKDANLCYEVLGIVSIAFRPLSLEELISLVNIPDDFPIDIESLQDIVQLCGSFLTLRDGSVSFVHQSAKEFLLERERYHILPSGFAEQHYFVATRLLDVLSETLRHDIYGLVHPGFAVGDVEIPNPDPLAAARYACIYWVNHLSVSHADEAAPQQAHTRDGSALHLFFTKHYLHWLEALSLLRSLSEGISSMFELLSLVQAGQDTSNLIPLVWDAWRFVNAHKLGIEKSPLQAYSSALIFSPAKSIIKQLYHQEKLITKDKLAIKDDWDLCLQTLEGHEGDINSMALFGTKLASVSDDGTIKLWNAASGQCLRTFTNHVHEESFAVISDGQRVWAACDHSIKVWDVASGQHLKTLNGHVDTVVSIAFSGTLLASASCDKTIRIWNAASDQHLKTLQGHRKTVNSIAFSEAILASASSDRTIKIWDAESGQHLKTLKGHSDAVNSIAFSETFLASASSDRTIKIWDVALGQQVWTLEGHSDEVTSIAFSGRRLASGCLDATIKIWDTESCQCLRTLEGHVKKVSSLAFLRDGMQVASASFDGTIKLWDVSFDHYPKKLESRGANMEPSRRPGIWLANFIGKTLKLWDVQPDVAPDQGDNNGFESHSDRVQSVVFSRNITYLASTSNDNTVKIWDPATRKCLHTLEGHGDCINSVEFSEDDTYLALRSSALVSVWNLASGQCLHKLQGHRSEVNTVAFSKNNIYLASGSDDSTIRIWDPASGQCFHTLESFDSIYSVTFSKDNTYLASGSSDKTIRIWDPASGDCVLILWGHTHQVTSVAFSSDNAYLASGSCDMTIKIWDPASGHCLQTLRGHDDIVYSVLCIGDTDLLASLSEDRTLRIWDMATGRCLNEVNAGGIVKQLCFFDSDSNLQTEFGSLNIKMSTSNMSKTSSSDAVGEPNFQGYGVSSTNDWITVDSKNLLWLPTEYRPSTVAIMGSTVVIGCHSGRVLMFRF